MNNNSLDEIVKLTISIANPASNAETFDTILLIADKPTLDEGVTVKETSTLFSITRARDLENWGFADGDELYVAAEVAFNQNPSPDKLIIALKEDGETVTQTLERAAGTYSFYGICVIEGGDSDIKMAVDYAEKNEKLVCVTVTTAVTDVSTVYNNYADSYRVLIFYGGDADGYTEVPTENKYLGLAVMAKCFGYEPGSESWAVKQIATCVPSALTSAQKTTLTNYNATVLLRYANNNVTSGGKVAAGEWIDVVRFRDWLKSEMQYSVFSVIKTNTKVPYTDEGIAMIEGAIEKVLVEGQTVGGIATTSYDDDGEEVPGYSISVPLASSMSETKRESRILTDIEWSARLAGAIHMVEVAGYLTA